MSDDNESIKLALQITFGIFGVLGTLMTLASIHHRDSIGCVMVRRLRGCGLQSASSPSGPPEVGCKSLTSVDNRIEEAGL
jgi:hypothetical protein